MEKRRKEIESKILDLREKYRMELDPTKKRIIAAQGRALKNALEELNKKDLAGVAEELFRQ